MNLPKFIKIMGQVWPVKQVPENEIIKTVNAKSIELGRCDTMKGEIQVYCTGNSSAISQTLLHEVMHAITNLLGENDLHAAEGFIERMASALHCLIKDNPELIEYIQQKIK